MDVEITSKAKRKHVIHRPNGDDIKIVGGRATIQDKSEVEYILAHSDLQRGDIAVETAPELLEQYLDPEKGEPDKLNKEVLGEVTKDGLAKLVDHFGLKNHGYMPAVMKNMLVGMYIDNKTKEIIDAHEATSEDEKVEDLLEKAQDKGIVEHRKPWYVFLPLEKGIGRNPSDAQKWLVQNEEKLNEEIDKLKN